MNKQISTDTGVTLTWTQTVNNMQMYNVYNGEYPFDIYLGYVAADTPEEALQIAINQYGKEYPHPVIEEMPGHSVH